MELMVKLVFGAAMLVAIAVIVGLFVALPVMLLWNWLCPELFKLPEITFWQALGLSILSALLFKGSSGGCSSSKS